MFRQCKSATDPQASDCSEYTFVVVFEVTSAIWCWCPEEGANAEDFWLVSVFFKDFYAFKLISCKFILSIRTTTCAVSVVHAWLQASTTVWDLYSCGMLYSIDWYLVTDVLGQPSSPIFKGHAT